jgi:S1-C subfamily serine protease
MSAQLSPGNSGGPLLDTQGRLIGINFSGEQNSRRGYSIAVDIAKRVVGQLIRKGYTETATPGIVFSSDSLQRKLENQKVSQFGGVLIKSVPISSPADDAGLKGCVVLQQSDGSSFLEARDLIVGVDGKRVTSQEEFFGVLASKLPGQIVLITVSRVAQIGEFKRWNEVIPIKLITFDELSEKSEEVRIMLQEDEEGGNRGGEE